ncbi:hypothetical protein CBR_g66794 [Chara braunii]|uniref:FHA domain-containing protein n=1 Tax=Chara braunii TaxID=69332 RepID=A0A388K9F5_CHABU|nr:hypothetical protein CBR_g66794 [Chara braunii]|eukprot:GBG66659.1 hypothetical protein CBR_g66794 [Chara braunii]
MVMPPPPPRPPKNVLRGVDQRPPVAPARLAAGLAASGSGDVTGAAMGSENDEKILLRGQSRSTAGACSVKGGEEEGEDEEEGDLSGRASSSMFERGRDDSRLSEEFHSGGSSLNGERRNDETAVAAWEEGERDDNPESKGIYLKPSSAHEGMQEDDVEEQPQRAESPQQQQQQKPSVLSSSSAPPPYVKPPWSSAPGVNYKLEVLKEVIQYREGGAAFVFDLGSTHGTFINKQQVKARVYAPLHVGNLIRFGKSSRLYVFQGPIDLMPEEGLSKAERHALKVLEAVQAQKERESSLARAGAASQAAEVTWGMREDAEEEEEDVDELTWRTYKGTLTEKQERIAEKIKKREEKELSQGGLTQGQQTQIARNEQRIEVVMEELESLEETLNESIQESVGARSRKGREGAEGWKKRDGSDEEAEDSDSDEFYDRAGASRKKVMISRKGAPQTPIVETAETLLQKKYDLERKKEELQRSLKAEEEAKNRGQTGKASDKDSDDGAKRKDGGSQQMNPEKADSDDPLDQFMSNVSTQIEKDRSSGLKRQLEELEESLERVVHLLKIADPSGEAQQNWKPKYGKHGTPRQQQTGVKVLSHPSDKHQDALSRMQHCSSAPSTANKPQEREEVVNRMKAPESAERPRVLSPVDSNEPDVGSEVERSAGGEKVREVMGPPPPRPIKGPLWLGATRPSVGGTSCEQAPVSVHEGEEKRQGRTSTEGSFIGRKELKKQRGMEQLDGKEEQVTKKMHRENAEAAAAEDVALLLKHSGCRREDEERGVDDDGKWGKKRKRGADSSEGGKRNGVSSSPHGKDDDDGDMAMSGRIEWVPPQGQTGDGRTSLNDKLGY